MIVVDTNIFLRAMTDRLPKDDPELFRTAAALFRAASDGSIQYTTSEAVIAEAVWVLTKRYGMDRLTILEKLRALLRMPGCRMPSRDLCIDALVTWVNRPSLSFVDAITSTLAEQSGAALATLDLDLARRTSATVWAPPATP